MTNYESRREIVKNKLERLQYWAQAMIDYRTIGEQHTEVIVGYTLEHLLVALRRGVYAKDAKVLTIKWPETLWDVFKDRYFPKWLLLFFPVKRKKVVIHGRQVFPELVVPGEPSVTYLYSWDLEGKGWHD